MTAAPDQGPTPTSATDAIATALPRPEHPRPDFVREPWINLNGRWRFTLDPKNKGEQLRWQRVLMPGTQTTFKAREGYVDLVDDPFGGEIVVPFPWESHLSGVQDTDYHGAAWYQRSVEIPAEWAAADTSAGPRQAQGLPDAEDSAAARTAIGAAVRWRLHPHLCFGAVDWQAKVWVNGRFAGEHAGGYAPFTLDLSRFVRPGRANTVTVRVWDNCEADTPLGKQTVRWYTPSSGIWQAVWLEGRPAAHLTRVHVTPHLESGRATFDVRVAASDSAAGAYRLTVESKDGSFPTAEQMLDVRPGDTGAQVEVTVPDPRAWSPEDPHLYECVVRLASAGTSAHPPDAVSTYFGLRSVSTGRWEDKPYEYVLLNGEPVYLRGALDQAFHPAGLHTYPSDDAIRADVQLAKDLGLNLLRCHIKVNEPRYYYWCDKLGLLVMYDLPSPDVYTPTARANWEATFRAAVERDYSHPSIFAWVLFNETWGLEEHATPISWHWVRDMFHLAKTLDATRLVEDNSPNAWDHVVTDVNSWHFYIDDYYRARRHVERVVKQTSPGGAFNYVSSKFRGVPESEAFIQGTQPLMNSEYGGLGARQGDRDIAYYFKYLTTELRRHDKVCGYVYTELADVEWEHNGFVNYDRSAKEFGYDHFFPEMTVADLNGPDFVGLDCPPCQTLAPGETLSTPAFVSHWDPRPLDGARLRWRVTAVDRFGESRSVDEGQRAITPRRFGVDDAGNVEVRLPDEPCLATVALWLEDQSGAVRARNYVNVEVTALRRHRGAPRTEPEVRAERTERGYALSFLPGDVADCSWPNPVVAADGSKLGSSSAAGWVEYVVPLPADLDLSRVAGLRLRFEAAARTARRRIDWKDPLRVVRSDYPQTESVKLPSDLVVTVGGVMLGQARLPDDPADARGVLSIHADPNFEYASYGYLITLEAGAEAAQRMLAAAPDGTAIIRFEVPGDPREGTSGRRGGLNLYGAHMGAYPVDPTLFIDLA